MATVLERIPGPRPPWTAAAMRAANNLAPAARRAWLNAQFFPPGGIKWTHAMLCPVVNQLITHRDVLLRARPQLRALWQEVCPYHDPGATVGDWRSLAATERAFDCRSNGQMIESWIADAIRPAFPVPQLPGTVMKPLTVLPVVDVLTGAVCDNCEACVRFLVDFYRRPGPGRAEMGNLYSVYGQSLVA
ncbi:hypothetical protein N7488_000652 [Penicillium malachiteum]|nr:hypothetical protein N7488_000652 [Penicillium malachiteum]